MSEEKNKNLLTTFMQHVVAMSLLDVKKNLEEGVSILESKPDYILFSSFVVSVQNIWILITAGHILKDIETRIESGRRIVKARLIDNFQNCQKTPSIPFDFDNAIKIPIHKSKDGIDYGAILLKSHDVRLLFAGGVRAFDETAYENCPDKADEYFLLGFPTQARKIEHTHGEIGGNINIDIGCPLISIQPVDDPPIELQLREKRFYAKVPIVHDNRYTKDGRMTDIEGMSGGPIIAVKKINEEKMRYWIIAVQSGWLKSERIITACYMKPFINALRKVIKRSIKK